MEKTALFLNKDYFMNHKESDCLQVAYWDHALETTRIIPEVILPEILPFYYRAQQLHDLPQIKRLEMNPIEVDLNNHETFRIITKTNLSAIRGPYGYNSISIEDPKTGSYLTALHNESVKNIEKIIYKCSDVSVLAGFYLLLKNYANLHEIEYIEWQLPVSDYKFCKFLFGQNTKILDYIPAWIRSKEHTGMFEDVVVLANIIGELKIEHIQLLPEGQKLLDLIIRNKNFNQEPLVLPEIEKIINSAHVEII